MNDRVGATKDNASKEKEKIKFNANTSGVTCRRLQFSLHIHTHSMDSELNAARALTHRKDRGEVVSSTLLERLDDSQDE